MSDGQKRVFTTDGKAIQPVIIVDRDGDLIKFDDMTSALNTISYEHHEIHGGSHYHLDEVQDLSINEVYDIQITTPDTSKHAHLVFQLSSEAETEWWLYENVTINTAGTSENIQNNNRNSSNTSGLVVKGILNSSLANANSDTAVAGATLLHHGIIGAGRNAGDFTRGSEIILKQNEDYTIRFEAKAAGYTDYNFEWYEHTTPS